MPRTIKDKLKSLSAATAARKQAEAAESAAANALANAAEPGEEMLANGKFVVDLGSGVAFGCFGGNIVKGEIVEVIQPDPPEPRPTPPAGLGDPTVPPNGPVPAGPGAPTMPRPGPFPVVPGPSPKPLPA